MKRGGQGRRSYWRSYWRSYLPPVEAAGTSQSASHLLLGARAGGGGGGQLLQPGGQARSAVQALDLDIVPESQSI